MSHRGDETVDGTPTKCTPIFTSVSINLFIYDLLTFKDPVQLNLYRYSRKKKILCALRLGIPQSLKGIESQTFGIRKNTL